MVYSFFVNQKINASKEIDNILLVSATNKNKYTLKYDIEVPKCSTKYLETKKRSIACTKLIIEQNENWSTYFNSHKKKDDLADTVLQALSYINRVQPKEQPKKKKTLTARKPTQNQLETKYSKSNLAWFVKNKKLEELNKDKRFLKDLKRYFKNIDELIKELSL